MTHCLCQQHFLNHLNFKWENEMFIRRLVVRANRYLLSSLYSNIGSFREKKNVKRETIFPSPTLFWSIARQASLHQHQQIFRHLKQISDSHTPFIRCWETLTSVFILHSQHSLQEAWKHSNCEATKENAYSWLNWDLGILVSSINHL